MVESKYIIPSNVNDDIDPKQVGGKASNLFKMVRDGLPVPIFICLSTSLFEIWMRDAEVDRVIKLIQQGQADQSGVEQCSQIDNSLESTELGRHILLQFDRYFASAQTVSVRSSATVEDSKTGSFAGQMSSYLNVSRSQLLLTVVACFSSFYTNQVKLYQSEKKQRKNDQRQNGQRGNGENSDSQGMAVIIQQMVDSRVSGVLFTVDPVIQDRDRIIITSGYGLGEGVVGDLVETDTFYMDKNSRCLLNVDIQEKNKRVSSFQEGVGGTRIEPVEDSLRLERSLNDEQLQELVQLSLSIEAKYSYPQDIEWAFDQQGVLYLLQTRPVTTVRLGHKRIFDNANLVEGYPGVTTPLTFSIARKGYEIVFYNTARALGASKELLTRHHSLFSNMVGFIEGRLYYQISNWYQFYRMIPGMSKNIANWERSVGLPSTNLPEDNPSGLRAFVQSCRLGMRIFYLFMTLNHRVNHFQRRFDQFKSRFDQTDLSELEPEVLIERFTDLVSDVVDKWECTTINDFFVFKLFQLTEGSIEALGLDDGNTLINELLSNQPDMESVAPVKSILEITDDIRQQQDYLDLFTKETSLEKLWSTLINEYQGTKLLSRIKEHIRCYGDRNVGELMLEQPTISEDPTYLVSMIQAYLNSERSYSQLEERMQLGLKDGEQQMEIRLKRRPLQRSFFKLLLNRCRQAVSQRENLRFARTRVFGMIRKLFLEMGSRWEEEGIIDTKRDIFFLTYEEIIGYVRGTSVTLDLKKLILLRTQEYNDFHDRLPAQRITTFGTVYNNRFSQQSTQRTSNLAHSNELSGVGCSPGKVTGTAKIVTDPRQVEDISQSILVAEMTDPGWVFLMVAAKGLIVERGNILSHTAIIGRELGIPTIIGVENATQRIADGAVVTMNGETGNILIEN